MLFTRLNAEFERCRNSVYDSNERKFLLSKIAGSTQEADLSVPVNCDGFGRIHHFRRYIDPVWINDPLPIDPACKALKIPYNNLIETQVFQLAACNVHCWYCFVPDELKKGSKIHSEWFTAKEMVELFKKAKGKTKVLDLSGGNPELCPEWILDTMRALEEGDLQDSVYLWSDDTLTTDYTFEYLTKEELKYMASYKNYGKVCCFKGFDHYSFRFNSKLPKELFDKQFERFAKYMDTGMDLYAYVTFTTDRHEGIDEKIGIFIDRLQKIHPLLPLRTVPLKIFVFTPTGARLNNNYEQALENQYIAIKAWKSELTKRFTKDQLNERISDIIL